MSLTDDLKQVLDSLEWYSDRNHYDDEHAPGEATLFGFEYDLGRKAGVALEQGRSLLKRLELAERELAEVKAAKREQIQVMDFRNIHIDLWVHTFVASNSIPLLAQAYQAYSRGRGLGAIFVGVFWLPDPDGYLTYQVKSSYLSRKDIEKQVSEPFLTELDDAVRQYDPFAQAVLVFYGNDLSQDAKHRFSTEKNFFKIQIIGDGVSAIECAEKLGIHPHRLSESSVATAKEEVINHG